MNVRFLVLSSLLLGASCSSSGSPTLDTGLPRNEPANSVTPAQAMAACQAYEDVANATLGVDVQERLACTVQGIAAQLTNNGTCASVTGACLATPPAGATPIDFNCETATTFAPSGCTATIGELEDCVNALSAGLDHFTSQIDCSLLNHLDRLKALQDEAATVALPSTYPACASLPPACLDLLGWASDSVPPVTTGP